MTDFESPNFDSRDTSLGPPVAGDAGDDGDEAVGFGKPPRHTRFAPGQSGNPGGWPKGPRSLAQDLYEELQEAVTLPGGDGAGELTLSKQRSILRSLTAKAAAGDPRATVLVLDLVQRLIGAGPSPDPGLDAGAEGEARPDARERLAARIEALSRALADNKARPDAPEGEE